MKYHFYVNLEKEGHFYNISFPDFPDIHTFGDGITDAIDVAENVLGGYLITMEDNKELIPEPSDYKELSKGLSSNEQLQLIFVNTEVARAKEKNKSVNKMVTLPQYLVELGKEKKLNFSQILQNALREELHINNKSVGNATNINFEKAMENLKRKTSTEVAIGFDDKGDIKMHNFKTDGNIIVGGTTGVGKSVVMKQMILSAMMQYDPDDVKFVLYDPKCVEFKPYEKTSYLYSHVLHDDNELEKVLSKVKSELHKRQRELNKFTSLVIVIDEFSDLGIQNASVVSLIKELAKAGTEFGIHFIIGTQMARANIITKELKQYFRSRVALKLNNNIESEIVLDEKGAEKLRNHGSMLYKNNGGELIKLQSDFIYDDKIEDICANLK
ncbi:FtsK/SpoIIIE domain-containing protein [Staphylococcus warneri]|uniref:FtsK/SpoIIIE domain-containing protein n=1 Tax=Staphylococcus warneri TaxID=1292 RepID=UPI001A8C63A6|nr:FtsK/SpoIIIE domain-containing protein [Staphylococcus warneri]MBO0377095.1 type II toxin-antitoxin system HicB family antitoxin [Staphylococcus warneri]